MWQRIKVNLNQLVLLVKETEINNISILSGSVLVSQVISMLSQPVATRLYAPADFGVLALITSLVSMFGPSVNGQYHFCIVTADSDKEANNVTALSFYFGLIVSAIVSLGIIIYTILKPDTFIEAGFWIYISIPLIFISGIFNVISSYNNRYKQYKLVASVGIKRSVASAICKIGLGFAKTGVIGLIASSLVGTIIGVKKQSEYLRLNLSKIFSSNLKELHFILKKYKSQPLFSAPGIFVVSYSFSIVPIFISTGYGIQEVGYYSLAVSMLYLPIGLIANSVGTVYFRKASQEKTETGIFYRSFKSTFVLLALVSVVPFIGLFFLAEPLFAFIFGNEWFRSGTFVRLLIPWYWMNFIVGALVSSLIISGNQLTKLIIQCFFLIEAFTIFYLSKYLKLSIEQFLLSISLAYSFMYVILLLVIYKASRRCTTQE
ncbi:MAG: oligosaccharide flippase family protein [Bacteroidales bacterium]|nr:oligosaccharide flippase family protein [Bacteroidales bacterium]